MFERTNIQFIAILLAVTVALPVAVDGAHALERRPNIVLLIADDLGYGELGCQGNPEIPTPNIDSIALDGVRFTDGYVTGPYCSTSRAGLFSGRYQNRFGYEFNPIGADNEDPAVGLPPSEVTLAEHLRRVGYATSLIGKWHLGGAAAYHPIRRGFDEFFGFTHEGHFFVPAPYRNVTTMLRRRALPDGNQGRWISEDGRTVLSTHMGNHEPSYDANNPILRGSQPHEELEYLTDAFTREAVDFIDRHHDRPFFLTVAYNAVHSPLQGADAYMAKFSHVGDIHRRIFSAMLANLDDSVGAILDKLRDTDLEDNTLLLFISDNGGPTRELTSSNLPLRGEKGSVYEGGIRVPFMARWPGHIPMGLIYQKPVISLDIYPTVASAAGAPVRERQQTDGIDLLPYLGGETNGSPHESLYWRSQQRRALRLGDWKVVKNPMRGSNPDWQLYHLKEDISETRDLADERPEKLEQLLGEWDRMNDQMIEPFWSRQ